MNSADYRQFEKFQQPPRFFTRRTEAVSRQKSTDTEYGDVCRLAENWPLYVGAARIAWHKLGTEELLKTKGNYEALVGLVEAVYVTSRIEADRQVRSFVKVMTR